jgi:hypothetical protein
LTAPPAFFIPEISAEKQEQIYAELAAWCSCKPLAPEERIYSIGFVHDGEVWTATVGKRLSGRRIKRRKRGVEWIELTTPLSDGAMVVAIFAGAPYMVVTNARPFSRVTTAWENPFMAGEPSSITRFST